MNELIEKFEEILGTWNDLPDYVYFDEYRNAFIEFAEKKIAIGQEIEPSLAVWTLHHETEGRTPYFDFSISK
ncbi:hypothetical protein [Clostridium algidicarnis]|uniref:hypothetical protein n=1 Tax=Clostridium algidicarnis TaxID=37659 RepID=UPI001C0C6D67|nr:hypothetical protein [Clostridium algidicarnis]MBU3226772.1 hypothetical protein [Clostridium algidicarnis]MBU3250317.1 hypothetical protein [Clostridium algidicarnis]